MPRWWTRLAPAFVVLLAAPAVVSAAGPHVLQDMPKEAGFVAVVERPRALVEALRGTDAYRSALTLPAVREAFDSTPVRRFFQLVAYYERDLGAPWPELLDKLAGGGIAVGVTIAADPAPALLVVRGTDEPAVAEFYALALKVVGQEAARQPAPEGDAAAGSIRKVTVHGVETVRVGADFHAARVGPVIYVANHEASLHAGLALATARKPGASLTDRPGPAAARKLVGGDPLVWGWFDFAKIKEGQAAKDFFASTRKDLVQTIAAGGTIDAFRRADFLSFGLHRTADGFRLGLRLPSKRADLSPDLALHAPIRAGTPGSLPPLEPPGVVYSQSFYLDPAAFWEKRAALLSGETLKEFEKGERDVSRYLPNTTVAKLLAAAGPHHRVVAVANRYGPAYKSATGDTVPPFAVVSSMRDPAFGKYASAGLRAGALAATVQYGLTMSEETADGVTITSYRFPENKPLPEDPDGLRFQFVPSFAVVGDSLVVASRPEVIRDLTPLLRAPSDSAKASPAVWRARAYGRGAADFLRTAPEPLVTATVLGDGVGLAEAKKRVAQLAEWAATLGSVGLEVDHGPEAFSLQLDWKPGDSPQRHGGHGEKREKN